MAVILSATNLRKHFGPDPVLSDVTFQIREGDKIGLIGPNGCGKTTLLNIITGREESERGSIEKSGDVIVGYLEQRPEIAAGKTLREEARQALAHLIDIQREAEEIAVKIGQVTDETEQERLSRRYDRIHEELLRKDAYNIDHRIDRILHGVGFRDDEMEQDIGTFSGGELNRLGLAKLLLAEPDIMLLDEPSNHLDLTATEWLEDFLLATKAAIILVSHDRYFLDRVTNRTLELYFGTVDDYPGNFSKYVQLKEDRLTVQKRTYEKFTEEVEKAKEFIRRNHYGMKAAQAEDRRKKLEKLESEPAEVPREIHSPAFHFPPASRTGDIVFRVSGLSKGFGDSPLFRNLSFDIQRGERWAILGPNGCGKTTFLKTLLKEIEPDAGTIYHGEGVRIGYFDQHLHVLSDDLPVMEAIRPEKKVFEDLARRRLLGAFGLTQDQQLQTVGSLSGGQRCRAALAKLSAQDPNVMILDEPTNHLDLWAREALERALRNFSGTVLFISHDRYFVDQVADHLLIIQPGARFLVLEGNYSTFRERVAKGLIVDPFREGALAAGAGNGKVANYSSAKGGKSVAAQPQTKNQSTKNLPLSKSDGKKKGKNRDTRKGFQAEIQGENSVEKSTGKPVASSSPNRGNKRPGVPPKRDYSMSEAQYQWEKALSAGSKGPGNTEKAGKQVSGDPSSAGDSDLTKKERRKRKYPFRKVSDLEEEIFIRETRVAELEGELLRPEVLRDGGRVKNLQAELTEEREKLRTLYDHWEEATELNW